MEKAQIIVKKLAAIKQALHPDCNDPNSNIVVDEAWYPLVICILIQKMTFVFEF